MMVLLRIAFRNLRQAPRRTALLGGAIVLVTTLLVLLLALSAGVRNSFLDAVGAIATGDVNVTGFYKHSPTSSTVLLKDPAPIRDVVRQVAPADTMVSDRLVGMAWALSSTSTMRGAVLTGIEPAQESELLGLLEVAPESAYVENGRDERIGDPARISEPDSVILFANQAKRLGVQVDDVITIRAQTPEQRVNTIDLRVVAVARSVGMITNWTLFTSKASAARLFDVETDSTGILQLHLEDESRAAAVMEDLRAELERADFALLDHSPRPYFWKFNDIQSEEWTGQRLDLTTWRDEVSYLTWILQAIDTISLVLIAILLGIISIGIMNTMTMSIRERTREIGTLRAIGMGRWEVMLLFVLETALLALFASAGGALLGSVGAIALDAATIDVPGNALQDILLHDVISLHVVPMQVIGSVLFITLFTVLAAIWPALNAARLQPVTAMQKVA